MYMSWKEILNYFVQQNHTNSGKDYTSRFKIQDCINKAQAQCATWAYSYYSINTYIWDKTKTQQEH